VILRYGDEAAPGIIETAQQDEAYRVWLLAEAA